MYLLDFFRSKKSKRRLSQSANKSAAIELAELTTNEERIKPKSTRELFIDLCGVVLCDVPS